MRYIFILFLFATALSWGQGVTQSEEEVRKLISKSWLMDAARQNGKAMMQMEGQKKNMMFVFREDNTFDFIENGKQSAVGEWRLNPERKCIALAIQQKISLLITSLNEQEFVAITPAQYTAPEGSQKMEVVFKVVN
ncbi:hypothetical protein POV27_08975 [Aureisphaera galaxeae]|uniref:hypothetical protein n=1 Tax=Aureisphaera galaxeae TaxID=1538023 RepID=UPI0023504C7B|nr:hypothetical protein [Aureisphaera galaxeae]MDC8004181.1 hypothetical protein [Aureisphaera galaxeae]